LNGKPRRRNGFKEEANVDQVKAHLSPREGHTKAAAKRRQLAIMSTKFSHAFFDVPATLSVFGTPQPPL
jgi:hypothetical protein